jgi:hypothetical protein
MQKLQLYRTSNNENIGKDGFLENIETIPSYSIYSQEREIVYIEKMNFLQQEKSNFLIKINSNVFKIMNKIKQEGIDTSIPIKIDLSNGSLTTQNEDSTFFLPIFDD